MCVVCVCGVEQGCVWERAKLRVVTVYSQVKLKLCILQEPVLLFIRCFMQTIAHTQTHTSSCICVNVWMPMVSLRFGLCVCVYGCVGVCLLCVGVCQADSPLHRSKRCWTEIEWKTCLLLSHTHLGSCVLCACLHLPVSLSLSINSDFLLISLFLLLLLSVSFTAHVCLPLCFCFSHNCSSVYLHAAAHLPPLSFLSLVFSASCLSDWLNAHPSLSASHSAFQHVYLPQPVCTKSNVHKGCEFSKKKRTVLLHWRLH